MVRRAAPHYGTGALPFAVNALIHTYEGPAWVRRHLRGRSGWLKVSRARMETPFSSWATTIVAGITDDGVQLSKAAANAFFQMSCAGPLETNDYPPEEELDDLTEMHFDGFRGGCDLRHLRQLREQEEQQATYLVAEQARGERVLAEADGFIAALRRERRDPQAPLHRRLQLNGLIQMFEEKQQEAAAWLVQRLRRMREDGHQFEADVLEALENPGELEELYCVRWVARHQFDGVVRDQGFQLRTPGLAPRAAVSTGAHFAGRSRGAGNEALRRSQIAYLEWRNAQEAREEDERARRQRRAEALAVVETARADYRRASALQAVEHARDAQRERLREARLLRKRAQEERDARLDRSAMAVVESDAGGEESAWRREERELLADLARWQEAKALRKLERKRASDLRKADGPQPRPADGVATDDRADRSELASAPADGPGLEEADPMDGITAMIERELTDMLKDIRP